MNLTYQEYQNQSDFTYQKKKNQANFKQNQMYLQMKKIQFISHIMQFLSRLEPYLYNPLDAEFKIWVYIAGLCLREWLISSLI